MYIPKEFNPQNRCKQVALPSMKQLHDRYGDRVPQPGQSSGTVVHSSNEIENIRNGEKFAEQVAYQEQQRQKLVEQTNPEPEPAPES